MSDILPFTVFKLDINGDDLPFTLRPTVGQYGACVNKWISEEDEEFYTSFLSNLRPGTVICKIGEKDVLFSTFDEIVDFFDSYNIRPMVLTMALRKSKWVLVKESLHFIATVLKERMNAGFTPEELAQRRRNCFEYLKAAKMGALDHISMYTAMEGIDRDFRDNIGWTALHYAVGNGSVDVVKLLLKKNVDVYVAENNGMTPLHIAAFHGQDACVELLLNYRASKTGFLANQTDVYGRTAVHLCAISGNLPMMKTFSDNGVGLFKTDTKDGWVPLMYAVQNRNADIVTFLLEQGANVYQRTFNRKTVLQLAINTRDETVINILMEHLKRQKSHRIFEIDTEPWLGKGRCELWVGDRFSCAESKVRAAQLTCVISVMSERAVQQMPGGWLEDAEDVEHYHVPCNDGDGKKSWKVLLPILPHFANILSRKLYDGHKVLVHCRQGTSVCAAAIMSMLIIKRGITNDPDRTGSPYLRIEEMLKQYNERHPSPAISKAFLSGLHHLQGRIDKNRIEKSYERVDQLLRIV
jgi:hypothetical protein